jgi:hypothetical protein
LLIAMAFKDQRRPDTKNHARVGQHMEKNNSAINFTVMRPLRTPKCAIGIYLRSFHNHSTASCNNLPLSPT